MIDGLRTTALLGAFRGEPPVDRDALATVLVGARPPRRRAPGRRERRREPAHRPRRAGRSRSTRSSSSARRRRRRAPHAARTTTRCARASRRSSIRAASSSPARRRIRASSASRRSTTCLRFGYRGARLPGESRRRRGARPRRRCATSRRSRRRRRPRLRLHAGGRERRRCCAPAPRAASAPPSSRAAATPSPATRARRARRAGRDAPNALRHAARGSERPGLVSTGGVDVRADRRALPARRPHLDREPERQPALRRSSTTRALTGIGVVEGDLGRQLRADDGRRLPRVLRRRRRRPRSRSPTSKASATATGAIAAFRRADRARKPLVVLKGGASRVGAARGREPHGRARERRSRLRRPLPPDRRAARADRRGRRSTGPRPSRRSRCRAARASSSSRPSAAGASSRPTRCAGRRSSWCRCRTTSAPRSIALVPSRWSRQQPDRPRGRRDARHDPDGARSRRAPSRRRRGRRSSASASRRTRRGSSAPGAVLPEHGLDRIVEFHERQDRRYAEAAREASERLREAGAGREQSSPYARSLRTAAATPDRSPCAGRAAVLSERASCRRRPSRPSSSTPVSDRVAVTSDPDVGLCSCCRWARVPRNRTRRPLLALHARGARRGVLALPAAAGPRLRRATRRRTTSDSGRVAATSRARTRDPNRVHR